MLTRIISLTVRDIRSWAGQHTFEFNDGVTVLHGRNQIGEVHVGLGTMMTLAYSAKSPKTRSELLPPGRSPDVKRDVRRGGRGLHDYQGLGRTSTTVSCVRMALLSPSQRVTLQRHNLLNWLLVLLRNKETSAETKP